MTTLSTAGTRLVSRCGLGRGLAMVLILGATVTHAADHAEAPGSSADPSADIADFYAWHAGDDLYAIVTFAGASTPQVGQEGAYDADILYTIHISHDPLQPSTDVRVRFGQNSGGDWGVQVENLPGTTDPVSGPVETVIDAGGRGMVYAGLRDDPFFMDFTGFEQAISSGSLAFFNPDRDTFAGLNATAIVLRMDLAAATVGGTDLSLFATTSRK